MTRAPIEDDGERLRQKRGEMPPPVPESVPLASIRGDQAKEDWNTEDMHGATFEDAPAQAWFDYFKSAFPQSVKKTGRELDQYSVSNCQCNILFNNMGSFNRTSEFRREENKGKPVHKKEKFNVTKDPRLSLLREFWGNNYAHVIMTAEADSLPKDPVELLNTFGLRGCHSDNEHLSVHARIGSSGEVRELWESEKEDMDRGHAAIFEVRFGEKSDPESCERSVDAYWLFDAQERTAKAVESGLPFDDEPTANCINDFKKRQLVHNSSLTRLRCCVCHLHHENQGRLRSLYVNFSKRSSKQLTIGESTSLPETQMQQHTGTIRHRSVRTCTTPQWSSC